MVFDKLELLLIIIAHACIVLSVPQRVGRRSTYRERELRAATCVQRVVNGVTLQEQLKVYIMTVAVLNQEIRPVVHHIELIVERCHKLEIVVGPVQTLTVTGRKTEHHDWFIRVVCQLIAIVVVTAIATVVTAVHTAIVRIVIIRQAVTVIIGIHIRLFGEVCTDRKSVRAFPAKPRVEERNAVCLIVTSVRLSAQRQCLTFALRNDTFIRFRV